MFQMAGDIVKGGWDALWNIVSGAGKGMAEIGSSFFPAPQRTEVKHLDIEQAPQGLQPRPTIQENQSMMESFDYALNDWLYTPYEMQYAVPAKIAESKAVDEKASIAKPDPWAWVNQGLDWALGQAEKVETVVSKWDLLTGKKPTAITYAGADQTGYSQQIITETDSFIDRGASVIEDFRGAAEDVFGQVKGLFDLGFDDGDRQPVFAIEHELDPEIIATAKYGGIGIGTLIVVLIIVFIIWGRK